MSDRKKAGTYEADLRWAENRLRAGSEVWCVRDRLTGLVRTYLAADISTWATMDGEPLENFTVQQLILRDGRAMFGPECGWPRHDERNP